jgi:hypothetical protein
LTPIGRVDAGDRIRAEELHSREMGLEVGEAVGDDVVGDVTFELDHEAVVAQSALGRTTLQLRQVDVAGRETTEDAVERAGAVGVLKTDDRGAVVTGRRRDAIASDDDESGGVVRDGPRCRSRARRGRRVLRRGVEATAAHGSLDSATSRAAWDVEVV